MIVLLLLIPVVNVLSFIYLIDWVRPLGRAPEVQQALLALDVAQINQRRAEEELEDLMREKTSPVTLKFKIESMIDRVSSMGARLAMMPKICEEVISKTSEFKTFLDTKQSNDLEFMQDEMKGLELYADKLCRPVRSAFLVFATAVE
ncbi:hypothetical protein BDN72DRAFT_475072 [Pluteus cervinus]|uniref:Uncharacterized protein n=1 Tax=Pluteus cervinus TaxID=181527 RepID=A0ACD3B0W2_9AGAR|nr:hypothetical protein BDN72DRAFT_475072 [Pluteus cervinus]